jgi:protein TonB
VKEEEKPPPKKELEKATASTVTVEGDENAKLDAPVVPDKGPAVVEPPKPEPPKNEIFEFVEQMPEFPGGDDALSAYLSKNIKYPKQANEQGISGRVVINFVVNENGDIADVKVARGIGCGCDEEAMRVVRSMPNWRPGKQNGKAVRVSYSLPITFELEE